MFLLPVIDLLRQIGYEVTIHDCGEGKAMFCLAVRLSEPVDLYYIGGSLSGYTMGLAIVDKDDLVYFPAAQIDAETYAYIVG